MKSKSILIIVLAIVLVGVCALCALTIFGGYAWLNRVPGGVRLWNVANVSAQVQESQSFPVTTPTTLEVYSEAGSITVIAADVENIEVELTRTAWAASEEEALAAAEALPVTFAQTDNQLIIRYERNEGLDLVESRGGLDSVNFIIRVPAETAVKLETHFGEISLTGTTGDADLTSTFGDLSVADVTGALTIHGSQGDISVQNVDSGSEPITLETSFGKVDVNGLTGGQMQIHSSNGAITIGNLSSSDDVLVEDQFGDITLEQFSAVAATVNSSNGQVKISSGDVDETLEVTNTFGNVIVQKTNAAAYDLETNNGELNLDGCRGTLTLTNNFGDVLVNQAEAATLIIKSTNGRISFSGSLDPASAHSIENSFGDIQLNIPADSAFNIDFETHFGEINSDLPVTVSGSVSETNLEGTLNGGGLQLRATTSNGNISLKALVGK